MGLVEILHDGERLKHGMAFMSEGRHHALGVDGFIAGLELLAGQNVDRRFLEWKPLQLERHPDPKRGD